MPDVAEIAAQSIASLEAVRTYTSPIGALRGVARFHEETVLKRFLEALPLPNDHSFLDVGCGYGHKLKWLQELGINATGVDINPAHIQAVRSAGMNAISIKDFDSSHTMYDGMLMSHIVEHFTPERLLEFLDHYLTRLRIGGYLVIATPLPWMKFLQDFDHVRPYPPGAIAEVFSADSAQVQYHAANRLRLVDLAVRRMPYIASPTNTNYARLHPPGRIWWLRYRVVPAVNRRLFKYSGGVFGGETTGWLGVYQKRP